MTDDESIAITKQIVLNLEDTFNITLPTSQKAVIYSYIVGTDHLDANTNSGIDLLDEEIVEILQELNKQIKAKYNVEFESKEKMYIAIGLHLAPAIERLLNNKQYTNNPLLNQIKDRHAKEFDYCRILNNIIDQKFHQRFTDDELSYIALHFAVRKSFVQS